MMVFSENHSVVAPSIMAQSDASSKKRTQKTSTRISVVKKHQSKGIADTLAPILSIFEDSTLAGINTNWRNVDDT